MSLRATMGDRVHVRPSVWMYLPQRLACTVCGRYIQPCSLQLAHGRFTAWDPISRVELLSALNPRVNLTLCSVTNLQENLARDRHFWVGRCCCLVHGSVQRMFCLILANPVPFFQRMSWTARRLDEPKRRIASSSAIFGPLLLPVMSFFFIINLHAIHPVMCFCVKGPCYYFSVCPAFCNTALLCLPWRLKISHPAPICSSVSQDIQRNVDKYLEGISALCHAGFSVRLMAPTQCQAQALVCVWTGFWFLVICF